MKLLVGLGCLATVLLAASGAGADEMVNQLKAGKLQCYGPNTTQRSCAALAGYTFGGGKIMNQAEVLISNDPVGTMRTDSPVTFKGDAICGYTSKDDIDMAVIRSEGYVLNETQAAGVKAQIWATMAPRAGKEICTTYVPTSGGAYTTRYTVGGKPDNTPSTTVILVDPRDGYRVAP
ncbi:MAG TPA: hypothetical protein VJ476_14660 [Rhizomicrobium sp.]|nr:hypothetical protein [Rhizomicrobium sp.]